MNITKEQFLFFIFPGIVVIIVFAIKYLIRLIETTTVKRKSLIYKGIKSLNKNYSFDKVRIDREYEFKPIVYESFERFNFVDALRRILDDNRYGYEQVFLKIDNNAKKHNEYIDKVNKLQKYTSNDDVKTVPLTRRRFFKVEERLINNIVLKPEIDFFIKITVLWNVPKTDVVKQKDRIFGYREILKLKEDREAYDFEMFKRKFERSKLTRSLRYDVLRRDGFKCQICGRSQKDGVKLHVDHIVPISKGGKTELSNLRTLCSDCNLGKSDKIE